MAEIKAFVAHSFSAKDKDLIRVFLDYFETLAGLLPGFSWDHAQPAEPKSVSGKVLEKIADKTVFIGICGKTEIVGPLEAQFRLRPLNLIGFKPADLQWKTSDWIIQEIGLAVGRGMKVIIFLEKNVRKPGGLFGDIEYIPFTRENPSPSFNSLLEMLGTLMPRSMSDLVAVEAKPVTSDKSTDEDKGILDLEPQLSWDQDRYDRAAFTAIVARRDDDAMSRIDSAYRESPLSKGTATLAVWEARIEWLRMVVNQKADFNKIKKAVEADPANTTLLSYLALGYMEYGEHLLAAQAYEDASGRATSEGEKINFLIQAAGEYARADQKHRSNEILEQIKQAASNDAEQKLRLLSAIKEQAEADKDDLFQLAVMEEIVRLNPTDSSARFALAYKHSDAGNTDMALYHYEKIPVFARNSITWNNLGVSYGEFGMRVKAVRAFRRSAKEGETLAMSNLGFNYLRAGFLNEAQQEADKAITIESYHDNINDLLKRLRTAPETEEAKLKETLDKAKEKVTFYHKAGEGVLSATPSNIAPRWTSPECVLEAKVDGDVVRMVGTYERPYGAAGAGLGIGSLVPPGLGGLGQTMVTETIEYSGHMRGRVVVGDVKRSAPPQSLLALGGGSANIMMVFNDDHTELFVAEHPDSVTPKFYTLTRSQS